MLGKAIATLTGQDAAKAMQDKIDAERTPEEAALMKDREARIGKVDAIRRAAAMALSDIDDLTAADIDKWSIPSFSV
jgi:hypothetical protein